MITFLIRRNLHSQTNDLLRVKQIVSQSMVDQFVGLTGDKNPIHSASVSKDQQIIPGALLNGIVSGIIGSNWTGALVLSQEFSFPHKCIVDRELAFELQVLQNRKIIKIAYKCEQLGKTVFVGEAKFLAKRPDINCK